MTPTPPSKPAHADSAFHPQSVCRNDHLSVTATLYHHPASGARVLDLQAADPENLLSVWFNTPPPDDTGLPHILEHAVLGGSQRYPVKDPFFHMLKMSLATFLNAMTGPDYTIYPCASNVATDFFNLAEVYLDAVFHPLLKEAHFRQEGFHLAFDPPDTDTGRLIVKGIVWNEMRGAYSSANEKMQRVIERGLFPESLYRRDAGGDPEHIMDLKYCDFVAFHRRFYQPSNALIVHYGNLPPAEWMPFIDERLAGFRPQAAAGFAPPQPRWQAPRRIEDGYPIGPDESPRARTYLAMSWLTDHNATPLEQMALEALFQILFGHAGAPLYRALIDARLGHDLSHCFTHAFGREMTLHIGIKGSEPEHRDAFESLALETLNQLTQPDAIDDTMIETALTKLGYVFQEIGDGFPLKLASQVYQSWSVGGDPCAWLNGRAILDDLRTRVRDDKAFFANLIRSRLLDNPHRLTTVLRPDPGLATRQDAALAARLEAVRQGLTQTERQRILSAAQELETFQSREDSTAALDALPQLRVRDLPRKPQMIPVGRHASGPDLTLLRTAVPANGVNYLALALDLRALTPDALRRLHAVYAHVGPQMGAAGRDYAATAARIAAHTGGLQFEPLLTTSQSDPRRLISSLLVSIKFLDRQAEPAIALLRDLLFAPDFDDQSRLSDLLTQLREQHHSNVVENALGLAMPLSARHLGPVNTALHHVGGWSALRYVDRIYAEFAADPARLPHHLQALNRQLTGGAMTAAFTGSDAVFEKFASMWHAGRQRTNDTLTVDGTTGGEGFEIPDGGRPPRQGLAAPMDVAFNVMSLPLPHASHPDAALIEVGTRLLSFDYLLDEIRFKGSAYGAGCAYQAAQGVAHLYSYRDPAIARTLEIFRSLPAAVRRARWRSEDIERGVIGVAKNNLRPLRPASATRTALTRHLRGVTDDILAMQHDRLLSATPDTVRRALNEHLEAGFSRAGVCIVSSRERLAALPASADEETPLEIADILTT